MKYEEFEILAIEQNSFSKYINAVAALELKLQNLDIKAYGREDEDEDRMPSGMQIVNDVAIIDIKGALTNRYSIFNDWFGLLSYQELRERVIYAIENEAGAIMFDVDSPGGSVAGVNETANFISNIQVPTISYTSGNMSSAAYLLSSQADSVYADSWAEVGSIGVIIKMYDRSKMLKDAGVQPVRFRSGNLKAAGDPDFKLSKEEKDYIQGKVDLLASKFYKIVSDATGLSLEVMKTLGITTGRTFTGEEAKSAMLVDDIISFDEAYIKALNLVKKVDKSSTNGLSFRQ